MLKGKLQDILKMAQFGKKKGKKKKSKMDKDDNDADD